MSQTQDVEVLRARIAELEARLATAEAPPEEKHHVRGLSAVAGVLVVLACVLAPLSVTSVWASRVISDTDQYVKTVAPLIDDPGVQAALADQVTQAVLDNIDVERVTSGTLDALAAQKGVPPAVSSAIPGLQIALVNGINGFVADQVDKIIASDQFAQVWDQVNRVAHEQIVVLLSGEQGGAVTAQGDSVTLNLGPVVDEVKSRLVAQGFTLAEKIPTVDKTFVLVQSSSVTKVQWAYSALEKLGTWLPFIAVALLVGGVLLARDRRRALLRGGLGIAAAMILLGVALAVARTWYVNETPGNVLTPEAAGSVFDTLVRFLRTGLRAVGVLGLVLAFTAFLSGPSTAAARTRHAFTHGIGSVRGSAEAAGWHTGRLGTWTWAHRTALRLTAAILGGVVLMFWNQPTGWVVVGIALVVVLVLAVIEFLARPPAPTSPAATAPAAPAPTPTPSEPKPPVPQP
ncbi:hypothetical protein ACT8ZV_22195 [Nocardioides sp. MAHUQ-72]|uniref:hypothetical protein n=1 Tax=unclassified Nocardioides TaxID=2615069 RepID=UPI00361B7EF0